MKSSRFAIDFGTTNSVVTRWNNMTNGPEIVHLASVCRGGKVNREIDDSFTIPSAVYLKPASEVLSFPFNYIFKRSRRKTGGAIGSEAIALDGGMQQPRFVTNFKSHLSNNAFQLIGQLGNWKFTAEDITRIYLKQLYDEIEETLKEEPEHVTFCVPVDFYEVYRATLQKISKNLGASATKVIDEPVAAALGYGLSIDEPRNILVIDFGGGTLDIALIHTGGNYNDLGHAQVIAKEGVPVGGNLIDSWIIDDICDHYGYDFNRLSTDSSIAWWYRMLLDEARKLKEALFFEEKSTFFMMPGKIFTEYIKPAEMNDPRLKKPVDYTRKKLLNTLEKNGLYKILTNVIDGVLQSAKLKGLNEEQIDDVIMVGGSTLLPKVYSHIEKRFGRSKVRAWQPFTAVAFGAAAFAAGKIRKSDHITHDYAIRTYDRESHEPEHHIIVPSGTSYPTQNDFWKRQLVPTCALGEPERLFKLIICEIGTRHFEGQEFVWDQKGEMHMLDGTEKNKLVIPLNESDPTMGYLDPPHMPSDKRARIEISFMINEDRWLCSNVFDLKTGKYLLKEKPVIRLK